ncbi:hypothetical protein RRG08_025972 [Elysia crispata]|uniref:Uncharacterized protein n=1 Tax=Elysia crispata TaxID=231223 RepID=A0AAE0ZFY1_9GAST|nr:hypothetical protein RRG08_025972 [Elysia crispata]
MSGTVSLNTASRMRAENLHKQKDLEWNQCQYGELESVSIRGLWLGVCSLFPSVGAAVYRACPALQSGSPSSTCYPSLRGYVFPVSGLSAALQADIKHLAQGEASGSPATQPSFWVSPILKQSLA